jgi:hypothetical protein
VSRVEDPSQPLIPIAARAETACVHDIALEAVTVLVLFIGDDYAVIVQDFETLVETFEQVAELPDVWRAARVLPTERCQVDPASDDLDRGLRGLTLEAKSSLG